MTGKRRPIGGLGHYVLGGPDGRTIILEEDFMAWAHWFETIGEGRRVARTDIPGLGHISTVFLGLDHRFGDGPPVLFETMSFIGDESEDYFARYCTWAEAEAGHAEVVRRIIRDREHAAVMLGDALVPAPKVGGPKG